MVKKPLVVFVFATEGKPRSTRYDGFAMRLQKNGGLKGVDVLTCALENLIFSVEENGAASVVDIVSGRHLNEASLVYLKSWESMPEEACALTQFLDSRGVPYVDGLPKNVGVSKLATMFRLWAEGIRVPKTFYIRNHEKLAIYLDNLGSRGWPLVIKDALGEKGKVNYLVSSMDEARDVLQKHPDTAFICQRFVANEGDYRVGVYMGKASYAILRRGDGSSHLNNTSAGGSATYVEINQLPIGMASFAEDAAVAADLKIAGVDVIVDAKTGKPMILEVNQGSQIVTGAYSKENMAAFNKALAKALRLRHTRAKTKPFTLVGRRTYVTFPELGIESVVAKIDTGAYSSSLHAESIKVDKKGDKEVLSFEIAPGDYLDLGDDRPKRVETDDFFVQKVRSSNGHIEERYSIRTKLNIEGRTFRATLTLTDRSAMGYPLLIGRKILRSRFLVNVELSEFNTAEWEY